MKDIIENIFGFLYTLSMGDYIFLVATFIIILAFIYVLYLIKRDEDMGILYKNEDINYLENVKKNLEEDYKPTNIELTDYEKEQEESAIISYEELIKIGVNEDKNWLKEGTKPMLENFSLYYFDKEGLHLTFQPYQVAPWASGSIKITIPMNKLNKWLKSVDN